MDLLFILKESRAQFWLVKGTELGMITQVVYVSREGIKLDVVP